MSVLYYFNSTAPSLILTGGKLFQMIAKDNFFGGGLLATGMKPS
jgi:hypothetical protein